MSDSDDDYYGPQPPSSSHAFKVDGSSSNRESSHRVEKSKKASSSKDGRRESDGKHKRERRRSTSSDSSNHSRNGRKHKKHKTTNETESTSRPFSYSKPEVAPTRKLPADLEDIREVPADFVALLEERNSQPSLIDLHREKQRTGAREGASNAKSNDAGSAATGSASGDRLPFDRERDFGKGGGGSKMDANSRRMFIAQNQGALYSSFSHGKRKFL